jgi:hypothetical protein
MSNHAKLSPDEIDIFEDAVDAFNSARTNLPSFSWDSYVSKWQYFVFEVSRGYPRTIYDYTNDLSARGILQDFLQTVSPNVGHKLADELKSIDEQFMNLTTPAKSSLPGIDKTSAREWLHRVPKQMTGELKDDILGSGNTTGRQLPTSR